MTRSFHSSYSVLPMAITNDMVIAVAAEDNDSDATEFAIHNTVRCSWFSSPVPVVRVAHTSGGSEGSRFVGTQLVSLFPVRLQRCLRLPGDRSNQSSLFTSRTRSRVS